MNPLSITASIFLCAIGGILLGSRIRAKLPGHHLGQDSKDIVKLGTGLIATLTALVLGLLVASAHDTFQSFSDGLEKIGANILALDRTMAYYGPETKPIRIALRRQTVAVVLANWPEDKAKLAGQLMPDEVAALESLSLEKIHLLKGLSVLRSANALSEIQNGLLKLEPKDGMQIWWKTRAMELSGKLAEERWLMVEQIQSALPLPFLAVLVVWLVILFTSFSVFAPPNKTVLTILLLSALSVSCAVFLMLELNRPTTGVMKASSAPLLRAVELLGQ